MSASSDNNGRLGEYEPGMVVATSRTRARRRQKDPIRRCQITLQACLSFVSTMLFLPVSICFLSAWWLMGSLVEYHVSVSPVRVACSGSALSSSEHRRRSTWERRFNWKALHCVICRFQTNGGNSELGWRCSPTSFFRVHSYTVWRESAILWTVQTSADNKETITIR